MTCAALIPLKNRRLAKSRLAPALDEAGRQDLVARMLAHVVRTATDARGIELVAVISDGSHLLPPGVASLPDLGLDLNAALHEGAASLAARGVTRILILPADLPVIAAADIEAMLAHPGVAIAPDLAGTGTNALLLPLPLPIRLHFGTDSFARHRADLNAIGIDPAIVRRPGLAQDVDLPEDLPRAAALAAHGA